LSSGVFHRLHRHSVLPQTPSNSNDDYDTKIDATVNPTRISPAVHRTTHLERKAIVYARQSTLKQLHEHRESTARQYALKARANQLGFADHQIELIDDDLGKSGASADWRVGFQRLAEEVVARSRIKPAHRTGYQNLANRLSAAVR
jgi:hypothetical protein